MSTVKLLVYAEFDTAHLTDFLQTLRDLDTRTPGFDGTVAITGGDIGLEEGRAIFAGLTPPFPFIDVREYGPPGKARP